MQPLFGVFFGRFVAFAFFGQHVHQDRGCEPSGVTQRCFELVDVVPVEWAEVAHTECFNKRLQGRCV